MYVIDNHQVKVIVLSWLKSFVVIALGKRRYQVVYNITRQLGDRVDDDVFYLSPVHKHSAILLVDMQWQGLYTLYTIFSCCHVILRTRFVHTTHSHKNTYFSTSMNCPLFIRKDNGFSSDKMAMCKKRVELF